MASTIIYKGSTIATVSGATSTLLTSGKYMEDNVTVVDVTATPSLITKTFTSNGTYSAAADSADGYSEVTVDVDAATALTVLESADTNGGVIKNIIGVDISQDTVTASALMSGYTAHSSDGTAITGTASAGIVPTGTMSISDDGVYDVTNYASADVAIDYVSKVRTVTLVFNKTDTTKAKTMSVFQTFGFVSNGIDFSNGIRLKNVTSMMPAAETIANTAVYVPKYRPIIVLGAPTAVGNYSVTTSYGEVIDVPHILGSSNSYLTKAIYLPTSAPDEITITIDFDSQDPYPSTVTATPLSVNTNGTYTAPSGTAYTPVTVAVPNPDFVVTVSYDSVNDLYIPDKTLVEIAEAYSDGKTIGLYYDQDDPEDNPLPVTGSYYPGDEEEPEAFYYSVVVYFDYYSVYKSYILDENGVTYDGDWKYTNVMFTTATASDVVSGKYFFTEDGTYTQGTIVTKTSSDLTASGATVTVPSGYYASQATKSVASGTEGTPTATKGTVGNHSISVTPSVTNVAGYISGGTHTGTAVSVSASELVSGTYTVIGSGTADVTNYASISVASGAAGTPTATKGTVSNHQISVTPSVTSTSGWIASGTTNGTAATVSANELVSGTYTFTGSGTVDVTNYASAAVSAGTAGTPTASKGTVSNHQISVTPSVTNSTGWITGSTKTGTAATVSASELVSGTSSVSSNGTYDITNYASVTVNVASPTFVTYYTGTAAPTAGLGSNGDIYLQS